MDINSEHTNILRKSYFYHLSKMIEVENIDLLQDLLFHPNAKWIITSNKYFEFVPAKYESSIDEWMDNRMIDVTSPEYIDFCRILKSDINDVTLILKELKKHIKSASYYCNRIIIGVDGKKWNIHKDLIVLYEYYKMVYKTLILYRVCMKNMYKQNQIFRQAEVKEAMMNNFQKSENLSLTEALKLLHNKEIKDLTMKEMESILDALKNQPNTQYEWSPSKYEDSEIYDYSWNHSSC